MARNPDPGFEQVVAVQALERLVADYCHELDTTMGLNATRYLTEDCHMDVGSMKLHGHAEIARFYRDFNRQVEGLGKAATRTTRHLAVNMRVTLDGPDDALIDAIVLNFSALGRPPLATGTIPTVVSDVHLGCHRHADGQWRISEFTGGPVFVGDDPLQNKALIE